MWHKSVSTKADAYLAEAKKHNGEVGAHALHFDYNSAAEFCAAAMTDGGYQHVLITPLDRRNEIPARPVADEITDGQAEHAYWQFDARRKGYAEWRGAPQSERDAFKAEYCSALAMCATNATIPVQVPAAEVRAQALGDAIEEVAKVGALWIDNSNRDTAAPILSQAIAAIRSLAQQSPADKACEVRAAEWISVEDERKPEAGKSVLMFVRTLTRGEDDDGRPYETEGAEVALGEYRKSPGYDVHYFDCYTSPMSDNDWITHWMSLPAAPSTADSANTGEKGSDK